MRVFLAAMCLALAGACAWLLWGRPTAHAGRFAGIDIIAIAGGQPGSEISDMFHRGIRDAAADLGCKVTVRWTHWEPERLLAQFASAVEAGPDGICIIGFPGQESFGPLVDDAVRRGIVVTMLNTDLPALRERYAAQGFGFAGQNGRFAGRSLAEKSVLKFGLEPGARALVIGSASVAGRGERADGALEALRAARLTVDYFDMPQALESSDPPTVESAVTRYLEQHPDVRLMVVDAGSLPDICATLEALGRKPGEIAVAGFDASTSKLDALASGYAGLLIDQDLYLEGYLPVLQVCLTRGHGAVGLYIETTGRFIDETNHEDFRGIVERRLR